MKKLNVVILSLFLIIFTAIITFFASNLIQFNINDKIVIPADKYQELNDFYNEYSKVDELEDYIKEEYYKDVEEIDLEEGIIKGMFDSLEDPYSTYMSAEEFTDYMESASGEYPGLGIYINSNIDNQIEIVTPMEDSPAKAAGLLAGDIIVEVAGVPYSGDEIDTAILNMKGEPGTEVDLVIYRPSLEEFLDFTVERAWIDVKVVTSEMMEDNIGYLRFSQFDNNSSDEFIQHFDELVADGAEGIVLDLRSNPGGSVYECVAIADYLLGEQVIVYTTDKDGNLEKEVSDKKMVDTPYVVLVDGGSASASEILTGAIQDTETAPIIGTQTYGKGVIQIVESLSDGSGFKLTIESYLTPNENEIHGIGIEPDYVEEVDLEYFEIEEPTQADDNQLQKAIEVLKESI